MDFQAPMIGRDKELRFLEDHLDTAAMGKGSLVLVSGEAGIGKTRLVEELKSVASSRGFLVLSAYGLYESLTPFMPFREALRTGGLEHLFAESAPRVDGAYVVTQTGILVKAALRDEARVDPDLFASMLATVSRFVHESLSKFEGKEDRRGLSRLDHGGHTILLEPGPGFTVVTVVDGRENEFLVRDMAETVTQISTRYGPAIQEWDGDEERVRGIEEQLRPLLARYDGVNYVEANPEGRRNLLFENVCLGLVWEALARPVLLCIEDLQWADPSTLALMHYLARNARKSGVFVVGTYRPEDLVVREGAPHELIEAIRRMEREDLMEALDLRRLPPSDTARVLTSLLGGWEQNGELTRRIHEGTDGNPFFLVELVRFLIQEGWVSRSDGGWAARGNLEEAGIPRKVQRIIERRVARLEDAERQVLDVAAINGEEFASEVVASSLGVDPVHLLRSLRSLEQEHRLIHLREGRYRFDHVKIKETLYDDLPRKLRARYHGRIAAAMEALYADDIDEKALEIAFHYNRSDERARALPYLLKGADKAAKQYANAEAIRFYTEALELEEDPDERRRLWESLASVHELVGEYEKALNCYKNALDLAHGGDEAAEILARTAYALWAEGELDASLERSGEALRIVESGPSEARALSLLSTGLVRVNRGEYNAALESFKEGLRTCETTGDRQGARRLLHAIGMVHHEMGDYDAAREILRKTLETAKKIGDQRGIAAAYYLIGTGHARQGDVDAAMEALGKSLEIHERVGHQRGVGDTLNSIGVVHQGLGDYGTAQEAYGKSLAIREKTGDQNGIAYSLSDIGVACAEQGDYDAAREAYAKSLAICEKIEDLYCMGHVLCNIGILHGERGDQGRALECLQRSLEIATRIGDRHLSCETRGNIAELYARKGASVEALDHCNKALATAIEAGAKGHVAFAHRIFGMIFRDSRSWHESTESFEKSIQVFGDIKNLRGQAKSHYEFGLMWEQAGDPTSARDHLTAAAGIFRKLNLGKDYEKAAEALRVLP